MAKKNKKNRGGLRSLVLTTVRVVVTAFWGGSDIRPGPFWVGGPGVKGLIEVVVQ